MFRDLEGRLKRTYLVTYLTSTLPFHGRVEVNTSIGCQVRVVELGIEDVAWGDKR